MTRFRAENREHLEHNQRAQFAGLAASQWLAMRLQLIGVVMVTGVATIAVIEHTYSTVDAGVQTNLFLRVTYCFSAHLVLVFRLNYVIVLVFRLCKCNNVVTVFIINMWI